MEHSHQYYNTDCGGTQAIPFKIDPEFQNKIPPIGEDEFKQLRENILAAGEVYEPLVVWDNTLVDGHNRWKVIQENANIKWRIRMMDFPDKWAAFDWMYKNQLGRRNLTDEQRTYTIGKMYEARMNTVGGDRRSEEFSSSQNANLKNERKPRTDEILGKELGVNHSTVSRSYKFAKGIDALNEVNSYAADKVLSGKAKITKVEVQNIAEATPDEIRTVANKIMNPPQKESKQDTHGRDNRGFTKKDRELRKAIVSAIAAQTDVEGCSEYSVDDLVEDIEVNGRNYVNSLRNMLTIRKDVLVDADTKIRVFKAIAGVIQEITKTRGEFAV